MMTGMLRWLLVALIIVADSSEEIDEGCLVTERFDRPAINGDEFNWIAFLTEDSDLNIHVALVERDELSNNDILNVKYNQLHREITRNGIGTRIDKLSDDISLLGWNNFSTKIESRFMNMKINNYEFSIEFEYPVRHLTILSSQMSPCLNGKPLWKIRKGKNSTIPTVGIGAVYFSASSSKSFSPVIYLNKVSISLHYGSELEVEIGQYSENLLLPKGRYEFRLEKAVKRLILSYKQPENGFESILEVKWKDTNITMIVSSLNEDFLMELMLGYRMDENNTSTATTHIQNNPASTYFPERSTGEANSSWTIFNITFLVIVCLILIAIIVIVKNVCDAKYKKQTLLNDNTDLEKQHLVDSECDKSPEKIVCNAKSMMQTLPNVNTDLEKQPLVDSECDKPNKKVDMKGIIENKSKVIESQDESKLTYKFVMTKDHQDTEIKVQKLSLGPLDPSLPTKIILILGEKSTGKSTTINSMVNHIFGIGFEDKERFLLIENDTQRIIKTEFMTAYVLPYQNGMPNMCNYTIIDTPGFGGTEGVEHDKGIMLQLENFLKQDYGISQIDVFGFVVKSDALRLTPAQRYVYDGLFSMFGNDINHNIFLLVTFAGAEDPLVLNALKDAKIQYHDYFKMNNDFLFGETGETDEDSFLPPEMLKESHWKMTKKGLQSFFEKITLINPVSLSLTKIVLEDNASLRLVVKDVQKQIKDGLEKINELSEKKIESSEPEDTKVIELEIKHNEELLVISIKEAQKLTGRLKEIPLRMNPLSVHGYIELLIENEEKERSSNYEMRILMLMKLKEENEVLKTVMNIEQSPVTDLLNQFRKSKEE